MFRGAGFGGLNKIGEVKGKAKKFGYETKGLNT